MSHLLAGGAGLTSGALAQKAGELKFETPVSPMGPRIKKGAAAIAAAAAAGAGSVQSAGPELFNERMDRLLADLKRAGLPPAALMAARAHMKKAREEIREIFSEKSKKVSS